MVRVYPHDIDAERSLLGAMLISQEACLHVLTSLSTHDFFIEPHRVLFEAMDQLKSQNVPIDVTTISTHLKTMNLLDKAGGLDYIIQLSESVPTVAHTNYYMKIVEDKSLLRRLIDESTKVIDQAYGEIEDMSSFVSESEKRILNITRDRNAGEFRSVSNIVRDVNKRLEMLQESQSGVLGVATRFKELDRLTSGLQKGDLIILAARPSMGKTAFALNIAHNAAKDSKESVAIFSLEMPAEQLVNRIISSMGGIDGMQLRTGEIMKTDPMRYAAAAEMVSQCNLYIDDTPGIRMSDLVAKCRRLNTEHPLKLVIIDYLQLIIGSNHSAEGRQQEVAEISRQLKSLARELNVPVIALSQLSRLVERREDKRPMLSDLRDSGSIEQDADIVAFLYRDDYYKSNKEGSKSDDTGIIEVNLAKHRNGSTGKVELAFEKNFSRFSDLAKVGPDGKQIGTRDLRK